MGPVTLPEIEVKEKRLPAESSSALVQKFMQILDRPETMMPEDMMPESMPTNRWGEILNRVGTGMTNPPLDVEAIQNIMRALQQESVQEPVDPIIQQLMNPRMGTEPANLLQELFQRPIPHQKQNLMQPLSKYVR